MDRNDALSLEVPRRKKTAENLAGYGCSYQINPVATTDCNALLAYPLIRSNSSHSKDKFLTSQPHQEAVMR
jgi:hypothetical protein